MVLFFVFNFLYSFVLAPFPSHPCFVGVCRSGATFDSQPCNLHVNRKAPGPAMRGSARRRALTRTPHTHTHTPRRPAPQTAKAAKAAKRGIISFGSQTAGFSWALKVFPAGRKGSGSHSALGRHASLVSKPEQTATLVF